MAQLAKHFEPTAVSRYYDQAQKLKAQIQQDYWDKIDRFFYNIDCQEDVYKRQEWNREFSNDRIWS